MSRAENYAASPRTSRALHCKPSLDATHTNGAHRLRVLGKINRLAERQLRVQIAAR